MGEKAGRGRELEGGEEVGADRGQSKAMVVGTGVVTKGKGGKDVYVEGGEVHSPLSPAERFQMGLIGFSTGP